jgi:hypothetical protein
MPVTNFPLIPAPVAVLALLGAGGLTVALLATAAVCALAGRPVLARRLGAAGVALPAAYALLLAALAAALRPGESYATDLIFRVPEGAGSLRLSLVEAEGLVRLLLGHESAPFAGETLLALR